MSTTDPHQDPDLDAAVATIVDTATLLGWSTIVDRDEQDGYRSTMVGATRTVQTAGGPLDLLMFAGWARTLSGLLVPLPLVDHGGASVAIEGTWPGGLTEVWYSHDPAAYLAALTDPMRWCSLTPP